MEAVLKTSRNQVSKNVKRLADRNESSVLVFGCGRFVNEIKDKLSNGNVSVNWAWYEPNLEIYKTVPSGQFEHVVMDNVLNVIEDDTRMLNALIGAWSKVQSKGSLWISIYEGNKTGKGEFTDSKCQRNEKRLDYLWAVRNLQGVKWRENLSTGFVFEKV